MNDLAPFRARLNAKCKVARFEILSLHTPSNLLLHPPRRSSVAMYDKIMPTQQRRQLASILDIARERIR